METADPAATLDLLVKSIAGQMHTCFSPYPYPYAEGDHLFLRECLRVACHTSGGEIFRRPHYVAPLREAS